jgi:hypothetical protein
MRTRVLDEDTSTSRHLSRHVKMWISHLFIFVRERERARARARERERERERENLICGHDLGSRFGVQDQERVPETADCSQRD